MFTIIGIMLSGIGIGFLLRRNNLSGIGKVITGLIWLLLFLLGVDVGGNKAIIQGLHTLGLEALLLTIGGILGSVILAWGLWYYLYKRSKTVL